MRYLWLTAFVVFSWAGAFGIAVGVHEWREEPPAAVEGPVIASETGPTEAELDAQKCEAALEAAGQALSAPPQPPVILSDGRTVPFTGGYRGVPADIQSIIDRYC